MLDLDSPDFAAFVSSSLLNLGGPIVQRPVASRDMKKKERESQNRESFVFKCRQRVARALTES